MHSKLKGGPLWVRVLGEIGLALAVALAAAIIGWSIFCFVHYGFIGGFVALVISYVVIAIALSLLGVLLRPIVLGLAAIAARKEATRA